MEQSFQDNTSSQHPTQAETEVQSTHSVTPSVLERAKERRGASVFEPVLRTGNSLFRHITSLWGPLYHNTTIYERTGFILAVVVIIMTFFPWVSIKDITITGWNSFLYPIALPIALASVFCMVHIIWSSSGKERPKWFPESHNVYILLGIEILQLGLITYAMLNMYGLTFSATTIHDLSIAPLIITFAGLGFIAIGMLERASIQQKKSQTIVHPSTYTPEPEETHELDRILEQREHEDTIA